MLKHPIFYSIAVAVLLMLTSCFTSPPPFIKFEAIPSQKHFPDYFLSDSISSFHSSTRDTLYVNALIRDHRLNEALFYCNSYLLQNPTGTIANYMRFKRFDIQLLQQFLGHYEITPVQEFDMVTPRLSLCGKSISKTLNSYLVRENIFPCTIENDTLFKDVGYPTQKDVGYVISLISDAKVHLDSLKTDTTEKSLLAEMSSMRSFLNDFEPEVVRLGVWKFIQSGDWDSASAYCDFMSPKYPMISDEFMELKTSLNLRPRLPKKSELFAGFSSAIIPGSGQIYSNGDYNGVLWLLGIAAQATAAGYLLKDADYRADRSEVVFGSILSLTSVITYISNINSAVSKSEEYNKELKKNEVDLYVKSLEIVPPGVKK